MAATSPHLKRLGKFGSGLVTMAITLLGLVALTFFIGRVVPIDPVLSIVGEKATQEAYDKVFYELGLDKPVWEQFTSYTLKLIQGDFGTSFTTTRPVLTDLMSFFSGNPGAGYARFADRGHSWHPCRCRLRLLARQMA